MNLVFTFIILILFIFLAVFIIGDRRMKSDIKSDIKSIKNTIKKIDLYNQQNPTDYKLEYPVFYINMDKHISRRDYITNQLDMVSHTYHRVKGFNGNLITTPSAGNIEDVSFVNSYGRLTKSEVGCCISHILAIKQAYESGTDIAMICEDDIYLGTYSLIPRLSDIVSDSPKDWKILQLYSMDFSHDKKYSNFVKNNGGKYIYVKREYPKKAFTSTLVYLINRKGMSDILQKVYRNTSTIHLKPVSIKNNKVYPPRGEADFFIYDLVESYAILPSLFFPDNIVLKSTIRPDNNFSKSASVARSFDSLLSKQLS